jgi:hypothetical protein
MRNESRRGALFGGGFVERHEFVHAPAFDPVLGTIRRQASEEVSTNVAQMVSGLWTAVDDLLRWNSFLHSTSPA